jgi:hypothetical protein
MPEESYTPVVTAFGLSVLFAGIVFSIPASIVAGGVIVVAGLLAWFRWEEGGAVKA